MRQMANGASAPGTCGFEPFVHAGLSVQTAAPWRARAKSSRGRGDRSGLKVVAQRETGCPR
jgi:hypothetical protein